MEDYDGALDLLTRAITLDPNYARAHFERGMALMNLDRDAEAVPHFDRALAIDPSFPGARDWRSRAAESLGDHKRAAEERLTDLRAHPNGPYKGTGVSPQDWADCAGALMNAGDHQKAQELLEEYFNKYVQNVTSYATYETAPMRMFVRLLLAAGDFEQA